MPFSKRHVQFGLAIGLVLIEVCAAVAQGQDGKSYDQKLCMT